MLISKLTFQIFLAKICVVASVAIHLIRDYGLKDSFDNNSDINIFLILYFVLVMKTL